MNTSPAITCERQIVEENENDSDKDLKKIDNKSKNTNTQSVAASVKNYTLSPQMLEDLNQDNSFDEEVEQILANFNEKTMDLTKLQTQIILLIKKYLGKRKFSNLTLGKDIKIDEKLIAANIAEASEYLIQQRSEVIKQMNKNLAKSKDNYQAISSKSRADFKKIIKNFAVYEVYKVMNPRRIAGETRRDNFAHNVVVRGLESAKHYTGGTSKEVENYSPQFLKKLENTHGTLKRGNSKIER